VIRVSRILAPNPGPFTGNGTNTYLVDSDGHAVVIDPGPNDDGHLAAIVDAAKPFTVDFILVTHTHEDHAPGANPLSERMGAATAGFGPGPEFKPDRILADNEVVRFGACEVHVVATPGHSADHLCYQIGTALFTGDHIMGESSVFVEDMTSYMASLRRIQRLALDTLYPGHGPAMDDPQSVIAGYIEHRLEREQQILDAVRAGVSRIDGIVDRVYDQVAPDLRPLAAIATRAHLSKLMSEGKVIVDGEQVTVP
jgi:glyoxylase-like metal-dependent hydrolase (beta-lactamase superfamily II)